MSRPRFKTVLHWFRHDLRLHDNTALLAASRAAAQVIPVYVVSDWKREHPWTGPARQEFLCGCLRELADNLRTLGGRLIFRTDARADNAIDTLLAETGAEAVFFNRDPDPYGIAMERRVEETARRRGVEVFGHKDVAIHERDELRTGTGNVYRVFGPYGRAWAKLEKPPVVGRPGKLHTPAEVKSEPAPDLSHWDLQPSGVGFVPPGETAARARLERFLEKAIHTYATGRDVPGSERSSRISQDLRWGLLSPREVFARCHALAEDAADLAPAARESVARYGTEIAWRDFYMQVLFHYPEVLDTEFNPQMRGLPWRVPGKKDPATAADLARWAAGETGFPIVDAGMRQLATSGFMHNRVRMIVSMFLTKDLRVHWREGERHFNRGLIDGEIASNNGGWQWSAGTGADAAPYFRIQNPWTQSARHDPQGDYIRRHLPELRGVPAEKLHAPPAAGARLAKGYPAPMVDHTAERDRTLAMFKRHLGRG